MRLLGKARLPRCLSVLAICAAASLLPRAAYAFCRATTAPSDGRCPAPCVNTGSPLFWGTPQIEYALHRDAFESADDQAKRNAIARAFAHWAEVQCNGRHAGFEFSELPQRTDLTVGPEGSEPNLSVVSILDAAAWSALDFDDNAFAKTQLWFDLSSGEILGADIAFNASIGMFDVCPEAGCPAGTIDLENVATHEIGHFLGLAHSADSDATMWCDAVKGDLTKRTLGADDEAGLCAIYGSGSVFIDPGAPARPPPASVQSGGCALSGKGRPLSDGSFAMVLLALLSLRRRSERAVQNST